MSEKDNSLVGKKVMVNDGSREPWLGRIIDITEGNIKEGNTTGYVIVGVFSNLWGIYRWDEFELVKQYEEAKEKDNVIVVDPFLRMREVFDMTLERVSEGKGKERHQDYEGQPFEEQLICRIALMPHSLGQAIKNAFEIEKLVPEHQVKKAMDSIAYLVAFIVERMKTIKGKEGSRNEEEKPIIRGVDQVCTVQQGESGE